MDTLAEVAETAATGRVACLYADIREVLGTAFVNLVYRHLATEPAMLDRAWGAIRPHLVDGALDAQAASLHRAIGAAVAGWPRSAAAGTDPTGRADIARLVTMYNHANEVNLLALTHLLGPARDTGGPESSAAADDVDCTGSTDAAPAAPIQAVRPMAARLAARPPPVSAAASRTLPGLPPLASLTADQRERIDRLNRFAEPAAPTIVASLYRHLAAWPGALTFAETVLAPLEHEGLLAHGRRAANAAARRIAAQRPLELPPMPPGFEARFGGSLDRLSTVTISKMVPIGYALADALGTPTTP